MENQTQNVPNLTDLLNLLKRDIFQNLNCHHLATIQSFNPQNQTVTATINYLKTLFKYDSNSGLLKQTTQAFPLLVDVPVIILGGGGFHVTFPIASGDQALILFNDRNIDGWFQNGQVGPVPSPRLHSFSDGIAIIGLNHLANLIQSYDTARAVFGNSHTGVGVGATKVKIFNQLNGGFGASLTLFFTALTAFMTSCSSAADPIVMNAALAFQTAMGVPVPGTLLGPIVNMQGILE